MARSCVHPQVAPAVAAVKPRMGSAEPRIKPVARHGRDGYGSSMNAITFDTHKFVKRLTEAGMPDAQAEILAEEQARLIENELATKRDLKELEAALKRDVKELETSLKRDIQDLEQRMTIRLGGMMIAAVGAVAVIVKLL